MSLKQYTSLIRLGDILFFKALLAQTILLGVLGLSILFGKIYLDKSVNDQIINNTFRKWESLITESVYIQQIVSEKEMPRVDNLRSFQSELKSYGVVADVMIRKCDVSASGIPLYIGKQKLNNCLFIQQDYQYIFRIGLGGFLLVFASVGVSLLVWRKAKKRMDSQFYDPLIAAVTHEVSKFQESESERIKNAAVAKMATQVAHDIRSPLEVLRSLNEEMETSSDTTRMRISLSINRIEEISYNLLQKHKEKIEISRELMSEELLGVLLSVMNEKQIEFKKFSGIELKYNFDPTSYGMFSKIDRVSFKNLISNLINNAVDSFNSPRGKIQSPDKNVINVTDSGSGIPEHVANRLFIKGFTTKKNGNGLGLYNAKQDIEAAGGTLIFTTDLGKGTTFTITLPRSEAPSTFIDAIHTEKYERIIVLDDDPAFHEVWSKRLEGLESKVEHIYSVKEMFSKYQALHPKILLLSDFELMDNEFDGIDIIQKFQHADHSVLVTARFEEQAIQDRCFENGIKLLPKSLVNYVKVIKSQSEHSSLNLFESAAEKSSFYPKGEEAGIESKKSPIVLIDDDKFVHINWSLICKKIGLDLHVFYSIDDFLKLAHTLDKGTRIYIDSHLGDGIQGEFESEQIFNLGFDNLFLTTGYQKEDINKPSWIKEIYSKGPDCLSEYYA